MGCGEDVDLWLRMRESGHLMKFIHDLCLLYRRHRGNSAWNRDQTRRGFMSVLRLAMQRRRAKQMFATGFLWQNRPASIPSSFVPHYFARRSKFLIDPFR